MGPKCDANIDHLWVLIRGGGYVIYVWSRLSESNRRPVLYESTALTD